MQFFQEKKVICTDLLVSICRANFARLPGWTPDKLMRARRLAFTDVPETEMNKKKETAIHVHFCGWNTQERNWKKLQFKRKVSKKWSGISEGKIALVVKRLVWSQHYVNLIETT